MNERKTDIKHEEKQQTNKTFDDTWVCSLSFSWRVMAMLSVVKPLCWTGSPILTPKPPSGQCVGVDYWISSGPVCFLFMTDHHVTFYEARMRCEALDATLVAVHDNATLQFLASMFSGQLWIGLISSETGKLHKKMFS